MLLRGASPGLKFVERADPLPLSVGMGASIRVMGSMQVAAGFNHFPHDRQTQLSLGTEFSPVNGFSLRGSYGLARSGGGSDGGLGQIAGGVGLQHAGYRLEYAFVPMGELGNTQRISLGFRFGSRAATSSARPSVRERVVAPQTVPETSDDTRTDNGLLFIQ
ncbi:MAG: hypothetical protein HY549_07120 [Elusimicrobia bacterium]|nr:hypothetical protein [Elusimicrobiota bacterium]